jgi:hypothetical protein
VGAERGCSYARGALSNAIGGQMKETPGPSVGKQLLGDFVVMLIFGAIALGIHAVGMHLADRTRALRTQGITVQVEVTRVLTGLPRKVVVRYEHAGARHVCEVFAPAPAPALGARIPGVLHPERPDRVRIRGLDEASIHHDREPFRLLPVFFLFPMAILVVARAARLKGKNPVSVVGPAVGVILLLLVMWVNLFDDVRPVIHERLGSTLLGLPSHLGVSLIELVVLGPLLIVWGAAALRLSEAAIKQGGPASGLGFVLWVLSSEPVKAVGAAKRQFLVSAGALLVLLAGAVVWLSFTG